jgi:quinol monooxygenase YgiN
MIVRNLSIHLKPNSLALFSKTFAEEVLPELRKQAGFLDEFAFVNDKCNHITAISMWENRESADAYQIAGHVQAMTALANAIEGTTKMRTADIVSSTLHESETAAV